MEQDLSVLHRDHHLMHIGIINKLIVISHSQVFSGLLPHPIFDLLFSGVSLVDF